MGKRITISYKSPDIETNIDTAIEKAMKKLGWTRYASGYDMEEERRDLCFEQK